MKRWTTAAVTVALLAGLAVGAAVAPAAFGQTRVRVEPNIVQWIGGGTRIGVSVRDAEAEDAKQARLANPTGVVIEDVRDGSPAEKAGFKSGDLVIEFDGEARFTSQWTWYQKGKESWMEKIINERIADDAPAAAPAGGNAAVAPCHTP